MIEDSYANDAMLAFAHAPDKRLIFALAQNYDDFQAHWSILVGLFDDQTPPVWIGLIALDHAYDEFTRKAIVVSEDGGSLVFTGSDDTGSRPMLHIKRFDISGLGVAQGVETSE